MLLSSEEKKGPQGGNSLPGGNLRVSKLAGAGDSHMSYIFDTTITDTLTHTHVHCHTQRRSYRKCAICQVRDAFVGSFLWATVASWTQMGTEPLYLFPHPESSFTHTHTHTHCKWQLLLLLAFQVVPTFFNVLARKRIKICCTSHKCFHCVCAALGSLLCMCVCE